MKHTWTSWQNYKGLSTVCLDPEALAFLDEGQSPGSWFEKNIRLLKNNEKIDAALVPGPHDRVFFVKRYRARRLWQRVFFRFFRDQVRRTLLVSRLLASAGVPVPRPLAAIRDFEGRLPATYFICEALTDAVTLRHLVQNQMLSRGELDHVMDRLAGTMAGMHGAGIVHGDMKWKNIMIRQNPKRCFYLIDLDTSGRMGFFRKRLYALDLARFAVDIAERTNSPDLMRTFLDRYSRETGIETSTLISHMTPFYAKVSAKHRKKTGTITPPLYFRS
jgi:tRNA A-37 threonylcarbamoyl transferase component Bud32